VSVLASILDVAMVGALLRVCGLALLAGVVTAAVAFAYRVRARAQFPEGPALIVGLGVVAIYLNTRLALVQFIGEGGISLSAGEATVNIVVFVTAGTAATVGRRVGDGAATSNRFGWEAFRPTLTPIVRAAGRFITVTLPEEIDDIEGYDSVPDEHKRTLAGRTFDFPRGLSVAELETQLELRLKGNHDVGYVDVEVDETGAVTYLAVGRGAAGIGPTLPPGGAAVAVRADPPFSATSGDTVQIWHDGDEGGRVGTAELRASVGRVATVATERAVADRIDPTREYRLMTLSADSRPDREFAAMLRRGDETMGTVTVSETSALVGLSSRALDLAIIAVRSADGETETLPKRGRAVRAGDQLFALGRPDRLRKLEALAEPRAAADPDATAESTAANAAGATETADRRWEAGVPPDADGDGPRRPGEVVEDDR
jgi:hypothetical protein